MPRGRALGEPVSLRASLLFPGANRRVEGCYKGRVLLGAYATHLVDVAQRFGVDAEELLGPLGLTLAGLQAANTRLEVSQLIALIERARTLTGEPALGVYLGLAMRASWHGHLGFAVLMARNVGDALDLGRRFVATRTSALTFDVAVEGDEAVVTIEERVDFGPSRDVVLLALTLGFSSIGQALTGRELDGRIELALPEPAWFAALNVPRRERLSWGHRAHRLCFPASALETPFALADAAAQRLAAQQCERELAALDTEGRFSTRVRGLLLTERGVAEVDAVAKALAVSARTLKRRLAAEGTSYSELLELERRARAEALLKHTRKPVKEIAALLGYADSAAFSHAFQRWTGRPPSGERGAHGNQEDEDDTAGPRPRR